MEAALLQVDHAVRMAAAYHRTRSAATTQGRAKPLTIDRNRSDIGGILRTSAVDTIAGLLSRYGLVVVIGWIGAMKFADFEAHQIQPLVANSPFMGWLYEIFPVYTFSALLGVFELTAAVLIAIKPVSPKLSIVGSALAIVLFLATISFLFTTPGVTEAAGGGFPALSNDGEFLLKDVALLGVSVWTLADSIRATRWRSTADPASAPTQPASSLGTSSTTS